MKDVSNEITIFGLTEYPREYGRILKQEIPEKLITSIWNVRDLRLLIEHYVSYNRIRKTSLTVLPTLPTPRGSRPPQGH